MRDETEITQSFPAVEPQPVPPPPPPGPSQPGPPPPWRDDVWPWLALLAALAVGGLLLWLFVLRGGAEKGKVVPSVVGLPQQQAIKQLTDDGYDVRAVVQPARQPRGIVVSQKPGSGSRLPAGGTVALRISNGRSVTVSTAPPTTTTQPQTTTSATTQTTTTATPVPDVVGQDMSSAAGQIEAAGFVAETQPVAGADPAGQVTGETPPAGGGAPVGSAVVLQVAAGRNPAQRRVPSVVGQKAAGARAALLDAGFTARTVYRKGAAKDVGVVVAESPAAGASQPQYAQVTLTVGS